jgi:hypothetical protein
MGRAAEVNPAALAVAVSVVAFAGACLLLLMHQLLRGVAGALGGAVDHWVAWRDRAEAAGEPEPPPARPSPRDVGPYRGPAFFLEPETEPTNEEDRATSLGLCSAAALLAGVFTLSIDGPRMLAASAFVAGALLALLARRPSSG